MIESVTGTDFDEKVLRSDGPVLIDFWADWCGPCKALAPTLEEMAEEYAGEMTFVKVDIVDQPELASRYGVRGIPLLLVVKDGEEKARTFGTLSRSRLDAFVEANC